MHTFASNARFDISVTGCVAPVVAAPGHRKAATVLKGDILEPICGWKKRSSRAQPRRTGEVEYIPI
jgi:hypothetical protein